MATLTKHKTFKSLKQHSPVRNKKTPDIQKKMEAETEAFFQLLNKAKTKVKKA